MKWDYEGTLAVIERDDVPGAAEVYGELLDRSTVVRIDVDESHYVTVLGYDALMKTATDTATFSNVRPDAGPRILPLEADPPDHTAYRRLVSGGFGQKKVADIERAVRPFAAEMIDAMIAGGTADFAEQFAYPFPTRVLCNFLELPDADWEFHHDWVAELERRTGHGLSAPSESLEEALAPVIPYMIQVVAARRQQPGDDVISDIIRGEVHGEHLPDIAVVFMGITLMMAGHITTTSGLGNLVLRLARDQALQDFLRANPDRIPDAIEEGLRIDTPQQAMPRWVTADTAIDGEQITAGEYLLLNFASANVDPAHWPEPERFDIDRVAKRHLSFGRGIHQCVGAPLARMEMRVAIEELLARTSSFRIDGEVRRIAWPRMAVEHLPIAFVAA